MHVQIKLQRPIWSTMLETVVQLKIIGTFSEVTLRERQGGQPNSRSITSEEPGCYITTKNERIKHMQTGNSLI